MKWIDRLVMLCAVIAGYALFAAMLFITAGVIFRYVLGSPIFGSQDILEPMLICATMFGLAYCARTNSHVAVDLFEGMLGRIGCLIGDIVSRLLGVTLLSLLVWGATDKMFDALKWGDASNLLRIPFWPMYGLIIIGAALYALVLLAELVRMPYAAVKTESEQ